MADSVDGILNNPKQAADTTATKPGLPTTTSTATPQRDAEAASVLWKPWSWWRATPSEECSTSNTRPSGSRLKRFAIGLIGWLPVLAPTGVLLTAWLYRPYVLLGPELCGFHRATGIDCPGCGLTRSFCFTAHGELAAAFGFNGLGPVLFAGTAVFGVLALLKRLKIWNQEFVPPRGMVWSLVLIVCGCYAAKLIALWAERPG